MEEHGNGSATAMEKPSFMTRGGRSLSSDQKKERKMYYIHALEHPNLYTPAVVRNAHRAKREAGDWTYLNLGNVKWNWTAASATETVFSGSSQDQASQNEVRSAWRWLTSRGLPHTQDGILGSDPRHFFASTDAVVEYATAPWLEPENELQERLRTEPKVDNDEAKKLPFQCDKLLDYKYIYDFGD